PPGFPIRRSTDRRVFAPPRGLSQLITSFIASLCQGIHRVLLLTSPLLRGSLAPLSIQTLGGLDGRALRVPEGNAEPTHSILLRLSACQRTRRPAARL